MKPCRRFRIPGKPCDGEGSRDPVIKDLVAYAEEGMATREELLIAGLCVARSEVVTLRDTLIKASEALAKEVKMLEVYTLGKNGPPAMRALDESGAQWMGDCLCPGPVGVGRVEALDPDGCERTIKAAQSDGQTVVLTPASDRPAKREAQIAGDMEARGWR